VTEKLAGLVLPDATPVEDAAAAEAPGGKHRAMALFGAAIARIGAFRPGDWLLAAGGVALAAVCAVFPWYIFYNQDQFGVRPLTFSGEQGRNDGSHPMGLPGLVGERMPLALDSFPQIDFTPTGTVPDAPAFDPADIPEQPYPGDLRHFRLIHAENGRAMIEDEDGFWMVQRGSLLPDGSRLARIEQRGSGWVLVTTADTEIPLTR
jgi:hypothetical protein